MSSIIKDSRKKTPFWIACFRGADGRRLKKSTKTTNSEKAKELAIKWEQAAKAGREGRLTESQCRKVIAEIYAHAVGEPLHFRTAREYLREWVANKKGDTAIRTYWRYHQTIEEFLSHVGVKADRLLREITPSDVRSWRDELKRKGHSPPTVNGAIKVLRMPFKDAHNSGYIDINPCTNSQVKLLRDEAQNVSKDVFTPEQIAALIAAAPSEDWRGMIMLSYFAGLRLRDCSELRWNAVNFDRQIITVRTQKTGKTITVPIHPQFAAWLKKQTRGIGKAPVFPSLAGKSGSGKSGLSMAFKRIMDRAKIKGRLLREATGAGRSQSSLSFHSLRHAFISAMAYGGVSQEIRQKLAGHASPAMNTIYTHHELESLRAAIAVIPRIGQR
jgi:integrase